MVTLSLFLLSFIVVIRHQCDAAIRSYELNVVRAVVPLDRTVPPRLLQDANNNCIDNLTRGKFCYLGNQYPRWISAAIAFTNNADGNIKSSSYTMPLMGPPIHVQAGDTLRVSVTNNMQNLGLSIHWHGFEMAYGNNKIYDGVVGVTQCAIPPRVDYVFDGSNINGYESNSNNFVYEFVVEEDPGTYWYHTHAGVLDLVDAVRGPLIVHPRDNLQVKELVDTLHNINGGIFDNERRKLQSTTEPKGSTTDVLDPLNYQNERILFLSDAFTHPEQHILQMHQGGLSMRPQSKSLDGWIVGTEAWDFGTVNGRVREVISVLAGGKYKLRLINAGSVYAFRFYIPGMTLRVVEADSNVVSSSYECNEVILHVAERFTVEIDVPAWTGLSNSTTLWIHADTLESKILGYDNGVRAVLNVVEPGADLIQIDKDLVEDPVTKMVPDHMDTKTVNCYSKVEGESCLPLTILADAAYGSSSHSVSAHSRTTQTQEDSKSIVVRSFEHHMIDIDFSIPPQFAHFVRFDDGPWLQNVDPGRSMLLPDHGQEVGDIHPHTAIFHVGSHVSDMLLIWRNPDVMDHPIHLHGYKLEILDIKIPVREQDCNLFKCKLNLSFSSDSEIRRLHSIPHGTSVIKDTFILPAGGTVATRIRHGTGAPGVWLAHCHMHIHRDDGMAFVLNVGNYTPPSNRSWLPLDYPDCDNYFSKASHKDHPACQCYDDKDAFVNIRLKSSDQYMCSRAHMCRHASPREMMTPKYPGGIHTHENHSIPGWAISLIVIVLTNIVLWAAYFRNARTPDVVTTENPSDVGENECTVASSQIDGKAEASVTLEAHLQTEKERQSISSKTSFLEQIKTLFLADWAEISGDAINLFRIIEVMGTAFIAGIVFYSVGSKTTSRSLRESISLTFFSMTLWTFNRMYPTILSYNKWRQGAIRDAVNGKKSIAAAFLARVLAIFLSEAFWPFVYCFVCFPLAQVAGTISDVFLMGVILCLNLMCYVSIGSLLGTCVGSVAWGMIAADLFSQTTILCAGFYTTLPPFLSAFRYVSPVFYAFAGMVKVSYRWSDTFDCRGGDSELGSNQCFLEFNGSIEDLKYRGINVATFGDPRSAAVWPEITALIILYVVGQILVFGFLCIIVRVTSVAEKRNEGENSTTGIMSFTRRPVQYISSLSAANET